MSYLFCVQMPDWLNYFCFPSELPGTRRWGGRTKVDRLTSDLSVYSCVWKHVLVNPPRPRLLKIRPRMWQIRAREMELTVGGMSLTRPSVECVRPEAPHPQLHPSAHTQACCRKALVWQKYTQLLLPLHPKPAWAFHNSGATSSHLHAGVCDIRCAFTGLVAGFCGLLKEEACAWPMCLQMP